MRPLRMLLPQQPTFQDLLVLIDRRRTEPAFPVTDEEYELLASPPEDLLDAMSVLNQSFKQGPN